MRKIYVDIGQNCRYFSPTIIGFLDQRQHKLDNQQQKYY